MCDTEKQQNISKAGADTLTVIYNSLTVVECRVSGGFYSDTPHREREVSHLRGSTNEEQA